MCVSVTRQMRLIASSLCRSTVGTVAPVLILPRLGDVTRYVIDLAGLTTKTSAVSQSVTDAETSVTATVTAADSVESALGTLTGVRSKFTGIADDRRETGPGMIAYARGVVAAAQEGAIAFVQGDAEMSATTNSLSSSAASDSPMPGRGFGVEPQ